MPSPRVGSVRLGSIRLSSVCVSSVLLLAGLACSSPQAEAAEASALLASQPAATETDRTEPGSTEPDAARQERIRERLERLGKLRDADREVPDDELPPLDPEAVRAYEERVRFLADNRLAGRLPGTPEIEEAAVYIEQDYMRLGLAPAFGEDGYRQPMSRGTRPDLRGAALALDGAEAQLDTDFTVLGYSAQGGFEGPAVFVGYSIVSGPDEYLNYEPDQSLEGHVAIVLRFEPMDEQGQSKWTERGWTFAAALQGKISAAVRRGAEAVLLVTPPGADDERVGRLETLDSTSPPPVFDVPVLMVTPEWADALVRAGDTEGRGLDQLISLANQQGVVIELPGARVELDADLVQEEILTDNVGGILRGRGPLADEYLVIGAHYDHIGLGRWGSRSPERAGDVHPGADDNASGTGAMLMVAAELAEQYERLPASANARSVLFLAFTAEESGLNGSRFYVDNPIVDLDAHAAMLNLDMIGRLREGRLAIGSQESSDAWGEVLAPHIEASGLNVVNDTGVGRGRSDHANFDRRQIPNLFFFTGLHDDYHTAADTLDLINYEGGLRVANIAADIAFDLATRPEALAYAGEQPEPAAPRQPRVRVGVLPGDADDGVRIQRVFPGTAADRAGLVAGDVIKVWNGADVSGVESWRPMLLEHEPGDVINATVLREGEEVEVEITLGNAG